MIKVFLSRQIWDDPEDRERAVLEGDSLSDVGSCFVLEKWTGSLYKVEYCFDKEYVDKLEISDYGELKK